MMIFEEVMDDAQDFYIKGMKFQAPLEKTKKTKTTQEWLE